MLFRPDVDPYEMLRHGAETVQRAVNLRRQLTQVRLTRFCLARLTTGTDYWLKLAVLA